MSSQIAKNYFLFNVKSLTCTTKEEEALKSAYVAAITGSEFEKCVAKWLYIKTLNDADPFEPDSIWLQLTGDNAGSLTSSAAQTGIGGDSASQSGAIGFDDGSFWSSLQTQWNSTIQKIHPFIDLDWQLAVLLLAAKKYSTINKSSVLNIVADRSKSAFLGAAYDGRWVERDYFPNNIILADYYCACKLIGKKVPHIDRFVNGYIEPLTMTPLVPMAMLNPAAKLINFSTSLKYHYAWQTIRNQQRHPTMPRLCTTDRLAILPILTPISGGRISAHFLQTDKNIILHWGPATQRVLALGFILLQSQRASIFITESIGWIVIVGSILYAHILPPHKVTLDNNKLRINDIEIWDATSLNEPSMVLLR